METRIVEDLRAGRAEALDLLLETYGREIQAVAYLIVRDRFEAEDICAETLITCWRQAGRIRDPRALRPWLLRVASNKSLSQRRRTGRIVPLHAVESATGLPGPDPTRVELLAGIADLPAQMRAAVVLRYYADLSVDETAQALGKSPNTIKAQLQTALDRLRAHLADTPRGQEQEARGA